MVTRWDLLSSGEGEEAEKEEKEEKPFFGSEFTFTEKVIAGKRWSSSCAEGKFEDGTPVMVFEIEPKYGDQIKRCKRNPHEERLLIHDLNEKKGQGSNLFVATQPFLMNLSDWMKKRTVVERPHWALTPCFLESFRSLILTVIATRDLLGDFTFDKSDVYVSFVNNKINMRILKVQVEYDEVNDATRRRKVAKGPRIKCMQKLSEIVNEWLDARPVIRKSESLLDLKLLLLTMNELDVESFPPNSGRLDILLQSPIFHGKDKDDIFEFILGLEWRLQFKVEFKVGKDIATAMKHMGHTEVWDSLSEWYSESTKRRVIGFQLRECLDGGSIEKPNVAFRMLRIYRNVISHYKENKEKYKAKRKRNPDLEELEYKDASHLYQELEKLRPNGWAALHYVAVQNIELVNVTEMQY